MRSYKIAACIIALGAFIAMAVTLQRAKCDYLGVESTAKCFLLVR